MSLRAVYMGDIPKGRYASTDLCRLRKSDPTYKNTSNHVGFVNFTNTLMDFAQLYLGRNVIVCILKKVPGS